MSIAELKRENAELKAANLKLRSQVKLMETVLDSLSEGVVVTNLKGELLLANPASQKIVGLGPTDAGPDKWSEAYGTLYPDKVTLVPFTELPLYKAMQGEITDNVKLFIRNKSRPNGVFFSVSGRPLIDETGNLIGGVIAMRDSTRLEELTNQLETTINALQAQNSLMEAIFHSISDGVIVVNKDGKYTLFNDAARRMAGFNPKDVSIVHAPEIFGLFEPDGQNLFPIDELPLARALRGEQTDKVEMLIRNAAMPHGIDASLSAMPIYDENGTVSGGVSVVRDISKEKSSAKQLQVMNDQLTVQSQLLQSIFNSISDGVLVVDDTGRVIMVNPSAKWFSELLLSTVGADQWDKNYNFFYSDRVTPFDVDELPIMQAIRGKSVDNVEMFVRNNKLAESGVYLNMSGRPMMDDDGNQTGAVVVFHDVTNRIKTEEALAQAFSQGRLEVVDTILHNIGNAINSVTVGVETINNLLTNDQLVSRFTVLANALKQHEDDLSDYLKNDPQGQKVIPFLLALAYDFKVMYQELEDTVGRIRSRTRYIVDIIRTQNSYQSTGRGRKVINLADAISDAITILQESINRRQIQIEIDCEGVPQEIWIEESQFHQMLVNLIKNAIEAIDELAKLGELHEAPRIQIRCYIAGDFLGLDVTDNGIGIASEAINKIFAAGFTTKEEGNGLGLYSSANFVISSGGKIQAFSEGIGKGTTVHILFRSSSIQPDSHEDKHKRGN